MVVLMGVRVRAGGRYGITMAWELKEGKGKGMGEGELGIGWRGEKTCRRGAVW